MAARKRKASETPLPAASRRRSQRLSSSSKTSRYFEDSSDSGSARAERAASGNKRTPKSRGRTSGGRRGKEASSDEDDAFDAEDAQNADEEDDEDDFDEDLPPKVTFVPLPKMRDTGDVEYEADRLHENTLLFLKDLRAHNNRAWLKCACV